MELRAFFYCGKNLSPFLGILFVLFGHLGSTVSYFWGFICFLWLPWISSSLLLGFHLFSLVTLDRWFANFWGFFHSLWLPLNNIFAYFRVPFTLFGYPGSAVNKKRIGITPIPFLSRVSVYPSFYLTTLALH